MENHKAKAAEKTLPPRTELSVRDVLVAARALIEKPENWTQRTNAGTRDGRRCGIWNEEAECFCTYGALCRPVKNFALADPAYQALRRAIETDPIDFNDTHTHAEVLAAFDKAIAECSP